MKSLAEDLKEARERIAELEAIEAINAFGRLLELLTSAELKDFQRRAKVMSRPDFKPLSVILGDEIAERKIEL